MESNEKMEKIIDTSLEILEICADELLKNVKENAEDPVEMDKSLHILCVIGSNMERLQRLKNNNLLNDFID